MKLSFAASRGELVELLLLVFVTFPVVTEAMRYRILNETNNSTETNDGLSSDLEERFNRALDGFWVLSTGIVVLSMQGGFTCLEIGAIQIKNVRSVLMKNMLDTVFGVLGWYTIGFGLYYGTGNGFAGTDASLYFLSNPEYFTTFVQQYGFANTAVTIISGGVCSRIRFQTYTVYAVIFQTFIYPIIAHWAWASDGYLYQMGFVDFAGGVVVHALGGVSGFVGAKMIGPRLGRYCEPEESDKYYQVRTLPQHSAPFMVIGGMWLFFAWFAFNAGSSGGISDPAALASAERALINTLLGGTSGAASATIVMLIFTRTQDLSTLVNSLLIGLVSITAPCATIEPWAAVLIGASAGILYKPVSIFILYKLGIDDPLDVFAVHGVGGIYGGIMTGFFDMNSGLFYGGGGKLLGVQLLGVLIITISAVVCTFSILAIMHAIYGIKVGEEEQLIGLDLLYHNVNAYPEFDSIAIREYAAKKSKLETLARKKKFGQGSSVNNKGSKGSKWTTSNSVEESTNSYSV